MQPLFIGNRIGRLFAVYYPAITESNFSKAIIHVPAFAEEMNKSRKMVALQAQEFSNQGYVVLILDLFGTGESEGDFGDATWDIWLQNINTGINWLKQQGIHEIALWGLRIGALLAMDFACYYPNRVQHLIVWQPVLNGDIFITQFLRLRIAAAMMNNNAPRENTSNLKQQLLDGTAIEVAGYWLNPDLIKPLLTLRADKLNWQFIKSITIFEMMSSQDKPSFLSHSQLPTILQEQDVNFSIIQVISDEFWINQEKSIAFDLIKITSEKIKQWL